VLLYVLQIVEPRLVRPRRGARRAGVDAPHRTDVRPADETILFGDDRGYVSVLPVAASALVESYTPRLCSREEGQFAVSSCSRRQPEPP
jgi:hypothetical protein